MHIHRIKAYVDIQFYRAVAPDIEIQTVPYTLHHIFMLPISTPSQLGRPCSSRRRGTSTHILLHTLASPTTHIPATQDNRHFGSVLSILAKIHNQFKTYSIRLCGLDLQVQTNTIGYSLTLPWTRTAVGWCLWLMREQDIWLDPMSGSTRDHLTLLHSCSITCTSFIS